MKVYISGPITNEPNYKERFERMENLLKENGYIPVNPVTSGERLARELRREPTHEEYMILSLEVLENCQGIIFLDGWEKSEGAKIEHDFAVKNNKVIVEIYRVKGWNFL